MSDKTWPSPKRAALLATIGMSTERQGEMGQRYTEHIPKIGDSPEWAEWARKQRALEVGEETAQ